MKTNQEWTEADSAVFDVEEKICIHHKTGLEFSYEDLLELHELLPY